MKKFKELFLFQRLNVEQLSELAKLYFDLARGAFALVVLEITQGVTIPSPQIIKMGIELFLGIAFVYFGLVLLKIKERDYGN